MPKNAGFISHGAPDIVLGSDSAFLSWKLFLKKDLPIRTIVAISAHWMEDELTWSGATHPKTIHDFGGFPEELYRMRYLANGSPEVARILDTALQQKGWTTRIDPDRGLDHGVWIPLSSMVPQADIPILPLSLSRFSGTRDMFRLGRDLYDILGEDLFLLTSGGITHNLYEARNIPGERATWAQDFDDWTVDAMKSGRWDELIDYRSKGPHGPKNHPTEEHFLPLLVFAGWLSRVREDEENAPTPLLVPSRGMSYFCISLTSFHLGETDTAPAEIPKYPSN